MKERVKETSTVTGDDKDWWIRDSGLPEVPGVPWGPFLDTFSFVVEPVHLILPYSAHWGFSFAIGASLSDSHQSTGVCTALGNHPSICNGWAPTVRGPETIICKFWGMTGNANQALCSNQHKVAVFRICKMTNCQGKE